jgi:hypothetical protein
MRKFKQLNKLWSVSKQFGFKTQPTCFTKNKNRFDQKYSFSDQKYSYSDEKYSFLDDKFADDNSKKQKYSFSDSMIIVNGIVFCFIIPFVIALDIAFQDDKKKFNRMTPSFFKKSKEDDHKYEKMELMKVIMLNDYDNVKKYKTYVDIQILTASIKHADITIISELIDAYFSNTHCIPPDNDVLFEAIKRNDDKIIKYLVDKYFALNEKSVRQLIDSGNKELIAYFKDTSPKSYIHSNNMLKNFYGCAYNRAIENKMYDIADEFYMGCGIYITEDQFRNVLINNDVNGIDFMLRKLSKYDRFQIISETIETLNLETIQVILKYYPKMINNEVIKKKLASSEKKIPERPKETIKQSMPQIKKYGFWPFTWTLEK